MASRLLWTHRLLLIEAVDCNLLRNTNHISMFRYPYACLEYARNIFRTPTWTGNWLKPTYRCVILMHLIEDQREITVTVWNSNTGGDNFIASGRVELQIEVLSQASLNYPLNCSLHDRTGRYAGKVELVMRLVYAKELPKYAPSFLNPSARMNMAAADPAAPVNMAAAAPAAATHAYAPPIRAYPAARAPISAYPAAAVTAIPYRAVAAAYSRVNLTVPYPASAHHRLRMQYPLRQPYPPPMHPPRPYPPQAQPPCNPPAPNPGNYPPPPN